MWDVWSSPALSSWLLPPQVFLRESLEHRLEKQREMEVLRAAVIIQAHVLGYMARYHIAPCSTSQSASRVR